MAGPKSSQPGGTKFRGRAEVTHSSLRERVSQVRVACWLLVLCPAGSGAQGIVRGRWAMHCVSSICILIAEFSIGERMVSNQSLGQRRYAAASFIRSRLELDAGWQKLNFKALWAKKNKPENKTRD